MAIHKFEITRAPVYTLWLYIVALRLKYKKGEALTRAKYVVGMTAQKHGQAYGVYTKTDDKKRTKRKSGKELKVFSDKFLSFDVPVTRTKSGVLAVGKGKPIEPESVEKYLHGKFGDRLDAVTDAMTDLAKSMPPKELARRALSLYGKFRPTGAEGAAGFGKPLPFDVDVIRRMAADGR